jgi:phage terminase large subunit-like protein
VAKSKKKTNSQPTASGNRDYVAIAEQYARDAVADKAGKYHGKWIKLAAKRYIEDMKRATTAGCPFVFDAWHAVNVCDFIEKLPHVEGKWDKPTIVLHPAQVFFVVQLFGFRNRDTGTRRFTSALFATARKSGKSTLAAAILNYCLCCEDETGAQVISAATTYPQASIIFNVAKRMVEKEVDLREAFGLECWAKAVTRFETGSNFKPIHAKASTQDGLNPSHVALDEIHAHKTSDLLNVLTSAAGARSNPLWLYTTTEGYSNPGPWAEIRQFSKKLLDGVFGTTADHFLALFWAIDDTDDEFDPACWVKANPLIDVNPHLLSAIQKEAVEAKQMPSKLAEFRIKRLNRPASTSEGWIDLLKWQQCDGAVDLAELAEFPCWGGLDLASTTDLCAFRLVWNVGGKLYTHGFRWCPESAVAYRTERGTVPYHAWVSMGLIEQTPGDVTDYAAIETRVVEICERFNVQQIAYDKWNATDLVNRLVAGGVPMIEFVQGPKSYHPAMQALERHYVAGNVAHGGDPVLNWCASNIVARRDVNMNMAPDKKKSADKIDDMVALLMAVGLATVGDVGDDADFNDFITRPIGR